MGRAEALCGFRSKRISNADMAKRFNETLNGNISNDEITFTVNSTNVGGREYAIHIGSLSKSEVDFIFNVCKELEIDPYMILAIGLHESSFTAVNDDGTPYTYSSSAFGIMQTLPSTYSAYAANGIYYNKYSELYNKYNVNISDTTSVKSQLMVGMCIYAEFSSYSWGNDDTQVVNHIGEGSIIPENYTILNGKIVYKNGADWKLAPSTLEILYYRDIIAESYNSDTLYNSVYN